MKKMLILVLSLTALSAIATDYKYYHMPSKKEHVLFQLERCARTYTTNDDTLKYHYTRWFNTCIERYLEDVERFGITKDEIKAAVYAGSHQDEKESAKEEERARFLEELNEIRQSR